MSYVFYSSVRSSSDKGSDGLALIYRLNVFKQLQGPPDQSVSLFQAGKDCSLWKEENRKSVARPSSSSHANALQSQAEEITEVCVTGLASQGTTEDNEVQPTVLCSCLSLICER
ncbi:hypothetical protein AV530_018789 [Patagioenas fasciata monilis]|uniref:Uncharacterized protein n=1 Tax=Patagioenas fasciata monilis TaxID=372326 RepID=A0A1V4JJI3_PATFA|nr:hypothetical protein AV530_018789 [Patagioenas fasciata monilis]